MNPTTRARYESEPHASELEESVSQLRDACGYEEVSELPRFVCFSYLFAAAV